MAKVSAKLQRPRIVLVNRCIIENEKHEVLFIKRTHKEKWMSKKWEVPGGKLDPGQDMTHAMEREVLEETGLTIITVSRISFVDGMTITSGKYSGLPYIVIFGKAKLIGGILKLSKEHTAVKWIKPANALTTLDLTPETRQALSILYN